MATGKGTGDAKADAQLNIMEKDRHVQPDRDIVQSTSSSTGKGHREYFQLDRDTTQHRDQGVYCEKGEKMGEGKKE